MRIPWLRTMNDVQRALDDMGSALGMLSRPPAWEPLRLEPGWGEWSPEAPIGFMRDQFRTVQLRGLVQKATAPSSFERVGTLPAGFRPGSVTVFASLYNDDPCGVSVYPDGIVYVRMVNRPVASGWLALDPVTFLAGG